MRKTIEILIIHDCLLCFTLYMIATTIFQWKILFSLVKFIDVFAEMMVESSFFLFFFFETGKNSLKSSKIEATETKKKTKKGRKIEDVLYICALFVRLYHHTDFVCESQ